MARLVVRKGPYRSHLRFYTDETFLDSHAFKTSYQALLDEMDLDREGRAIVGAMVYVEEKSKVEYAANILLPPDLYRAVAAKDAERVLAFKATNEQLLAGLLLHRGGVVEMSAGEGKTISAAFPAVMQAVSGRAVHIITANDYLALRDAELLEPVYESLGISVRAVLGHMSDAERRDAYRAGIVYGTVRELGFDFLRDNLKYGQQEMVQGRLEVAIVDEADQALIDESSTPLIISGGARGGARSVHKIRTAVEEMASLQSDTISKVEGDSRRPGIGAGERRSLLAKLLLADPRDDLLGRALARNGGLLKQVRSKAIAAAEGEEPHASLLEDLYYHVDLDYEVVTLTDRGRELLETRLGPVFDTTALETEIERTEADNTVPLDRRRKSADGLQRRLSRQQGQSNQVHQSLRAHLLLRKDEDYVVSGGEIVLVDPITGRARPDSRYQHGLQAALEAKEGVAVHTESEVLARISVQGYMRQYESIAGMTGTALDSEDEFRNMYGLKVKAVPPTHGTRRVDLPTRLYGSRRDKLDAVLDQVRLCRRVGRPVLVGTLTVEQSEEISALLTRHGIEHRVLNAVTNADEAQIVRAAGRSGAVTVATNMAGRGTDIVLDVGLDAGIVKRYLELVEDLLTEGGDQVEIKCGSAEEADVLEAALASRDRQATISIERTGVDMVASLANGLRKKSADDDAPASIVPQKGKISTELRPLSLEFGLGLAVIATEMNDSSRIDRQLRGRGGRQGGFGSSRLILSREDKGLALQSLAAGSRELSSDSSGRAFKESRATQRRLDRIQSRMELEDETGRAAMADYHRVLEEQTLAHYRARLEIIHSGSFHVACVEFMKQRAHRLVTGYFPPASSWDYANRFDEMAEEVWLDYGVDCRPLWGLGIDGMAAELAGLMANRLEQARAATGEHRYDVIEKVSFLQTADELWRDHLAYLDELMIGTMLCSPGHRTAVAEYHFHCIDAYRRYEREVVDRFLPRLLRVDTAEEAATSIASEGGLVEDLHEILV